MGRIRTIKPEFWTDEELSGLPTTTHLFAAALLNYADDYGYFNANPGLVKAGTVPLREDIPLQNVSGILTELSKIGYVVIGKSTDGKRYGKIVNFSKHQRVSHPTPSKISKIDISWDSSGITPENIEKIPEDIRPEQGTGNREQGREDAREGAPPPRVPARPIPSSAGGDGEFLIVTWLCEELGVVLAPAQRGMAAKHVTFTAQEAGRDGEDLGEYIRVEALAARARGEPVDAWYLADGKWRISGGADGTNRQGGSGQRTSPASERVRSGRKAFAAAAERFRGSATPSPPGTNG